MAIKMVALKCPQCGADLEFTGGKKIMYCMYCGAKIVIDDENEYTYRYVDEAALEREETEQMKIEHEIELEEFREKSESVSSSVK